jgi:hypothetical protein
MRIPTYFLLACSAAWAQSPGTTPHASAKTAPAVTAPATSEDAQSLSDLTLQIRAAAEKSDSDVSRLRIEKWKLDAAGKQQAQAYSESIRRNLTYSMPDLLLRIQAAPASLNANFRLYRTLNALCDTFSSLVDSAGNFGVREQYDPIAADLAQLDRLRHQMADRVDMLAGANDAELARLRAQVARSGGAKPGATKVVVNDGDQPAKKKAKTGQTQTQPAK